MRKSIPVALVVVGLASLIAHSESAKAQGQSPSEAATTGMTVPGIVECGEGYNSHELYDVKITVLEIVRGDKAWGLVKGASTTNQPPKAGFDYVLARIKFQYFARGTPGDCNHELKANQFLALSAKGQKYDSPSVTPPKPELNDTLHSGDSLEGWVAFMVPQEEKKPIMTYGVDESGAVQHGGDMWFQLYYSAHLLLELSTKTRMRKAHSLWGSPCAFALCFPLGSMVRCPPH